MNETFKMLFDACRNSPAGVVLTLFVAGSVVVYSDIRDYIQEQRREQAMLNEKFLTALGQIASRLDKIEGKLDNDIKNN